jgi:hydrogenase small subunit
MTEDKILLGDEIAKKGVSRRQFLKVCGILAAAMALPASYGEVIAQAIQASPRLPVIWLEFQDCTADTESFLRASHRADPLQSGITDPTTVELLLDFLSVDYHETLMVPAGFAADKSLNDAMTNYAGQYVLVVEGAIPTANNGIYCTIRGKTALSILQEVSSKALATIALGTCATSGGLPSAAPNLTGAKGVSGAVPGAPNLINIPGCPANVVNLVACLVYYLTYHNWPSLDSNKRPSFAFGNTIHEDCPRQDFYESGQFVRAWGDAGHRQGWCLYMMGCKGPITRSNCDRVKWNSSTNWPIGAGHGCLGCANDNFWDTAGSFYSITTPPD